MTKSMFQPGVIASAITRLLTVQLQRMIINPGVGEAKNFRDNLIDTLTASAPAMTMLPASEIGPIAKLVVDGIKQSFQGDTPAFTHYLEHNQSMRGIVRAMLEGAPDLGSVVPELMATIKRIRQNGQHLETMQQQTTSFAAGASSPG